MINHEVRRHSERMDSPHRARQTPGMVSVCLVTEPTAQTDLEPPQHPLLRQYERVWRNVSFSIPPHGARLEDLRRKRSTVSPTATCPVEGGSSLPHLKEVVTSGHRFARDRFATLHVM